MRFLFFKVAAKLASRSALPEILPNFENTKNKDLTPDPLVVVTTLGLITIVEDRTQTGS